MKTAIVAMEVLREKKNKREGGAERKETGERSSGEKDLAMLHVRLKQCVARIVELSMLSCVQAKSTQIPLLYAPYSRSRCQASFSRTYSKRITFSSSCDQGRDGSELELVTISDHGRTSSRHCHWAIEGLSSIFAGDDKLVPVAHTSIGSEAFRSFWRARTRTVSLLACIPASLARQ